MARKKTQLEQIADFLYLYGIKEQFTIETELDTILFDKGDWFFNGLSVTSQELTESFDVELEREFLKRANKIMAESIVNAHYLLEDANSLLGKDKVLLIIKQHVEFLAKLLKEVNRVLSKDNLKVIK